MIGRPPAPGASRGHVTKQQYAYAVLREAILRCELQPGERLVIDDLARRLRLSIIPVREALRLLESEGLVVTVAHVGATVAPISRESIVEVFTILEALEAVAARAAALAAGEADYAPLEALLGEMDAALAAGNRAAWAELNSRFHLLIGRMAAMPLLEPMLQRALDHWDRLRRHFFRDVLARRADIAQREHHELVRLMKARDLEGLERAVRAHNRGALEAYAAHLGVAGPDGPLRSAGSAAP
ncbi:MAG TPA: GntR family transcriptional regulator [Vicinamibacterales bacterium]|nr:GntR family transcriptional regulator [Vicinamibacterales bacterium]